MWVRFGLLGVLVLSLSGFKWPSSSVDPPEKFLNSLVVTPWGMNNFPLGEISVSEFVSKLAKRQLDNGRYPEIKGWTNSDNVYTLHVLFGENELEAIFVHLLSEQKGAGQFSGLACRLAGEVENPCYSLLRFAVTGY